MSEEDLQRLADLYDRAEANKKRSRRALFIAIVTAVVVAFAIPVGLAAANLAQDNKELLERQTATLHKINEVVGGLQAAEQERDDASKDTALALAVTLENIAAAFATPPAPDPNRLRAVRGLCDTAAAFRAGAGDMNPPPCPAP